MRISASRLLGQRLPRREGRLDNGHDVGKMALNFPFHGDGVETDGAEGGRALPITTQTRDQVKHRLVVKVLLIEINNTELMKYVSLRH